jgi:hypothetical protein
MKVNHLAVITGMSLSIIIAISNSANAARLSAMDKTVLKQHVALCRQQSASNKLSAQTINNYMSLFTQYTSAADLLQAGNSSRIGYMLKNLKRSKKYTGNSLKSAEKSYNLLKKQYDGLILDKAKISELDKLEQTQKKLIAKIDKAELPFKNEQRKLIEGIDINQKNRELKKLLSRCIIFGSKDKPGNVNKKNVNATFKTAFASCSWYKNKKQIAWAHFRIRQLPTNINRKNKLARKYPISSLSNGSMWFWVGNFNICFVASDKSLNGKEKIKQAVLSMLDLTGLEKASRNKIIEDSINYYDSAEKIKKTSQATTGKLTKERYRLSNKMSDYKKSGYRSSAARAKLKLNLDQAKNSYEKYQNDIAASEQLIKIFESPASNYKKHAVELEKKRAELKNIILTSCSEAEQTKNKQLKGIDFNTSNEKYQIIANKFIRMPKSNEFALINRTSTSAWMGTPQINCKWSCDFSNAVAKYNHVAFSGQINYNPDYSSSFNFGMIDNKYRIYRLNDYSITVKAGDFIITLTIYNKNFYNKSDLIKATKEFYDLNAIANAFN